LIISGSGINRMRRYACSVALAIFLPVGARHPASTIPVAGCVTISEERPLTGRQTGGAGVFGGAARGYEIAEADRDSEASRDVWFRIGELLSHVVRKVRQDHPERAGDVRDRGPQHVATPVETDVAPPKGREGRP